MVVEEACLKHVLEQVGLLKEVIDIVPVLVDAFSYCVEGSRVGLVLCQVLLPFVHVAVSSPVVAVVAGLDIGVNVLGEACLLRTVDGFEEAYVIVVVQCETGA